MTIIEERLKALDATMSLNREILSKPDEPILTLNQLWAGCERARHAGYARGFSHGMMLAGFISLFFCAAIAFTGCCYDDLPDYHHNPDTDHCAGKGGIHEECCPVDAAPGYCETGLTCKGPAWTCEP